MRIRQTAESSAHYGKPQFEDLPFLRDSRHRANPKETKMKNHILVRVGASVTAKISGL
jgi:hypothetical protein